MLAWLWLIGLAAATGYDTGGRPEVAHAAQAALAALNDVQRLEQQILEDERRRITADVGPLETYSFLHQSLGLLFDTALTAIRHAMAASPQKTVLVEAASLEKQLTEMLLAHAKEPLFFWHGPKWMVKSKLDRLLARGAWHDEMKALANFSFTITDLLGKGATAEEGQKAVQGSVPLVGVVVDDSFCSPGALCSLDGLKPLATEATHVLVLPCPEATLGQVGKALRSASVSIYLSVSLPGELLEAAPREATPAAIAELLGGYISQAEKALGKPIDLVWMPYAAFKKQYWAGTKTLLEKQHRWAYGIQAEVTLPTVAKRLLERTPAPKAWLTTDDLLRPAPQEAVQGALDAGITCVSLPRKQAFSDFAALYFKMAGLTEAPALAHLRWAQHRGLASVLPLEQIVASSGSQGGALVYWKLLQAPAHSVDQSQLKLYDAENGYPLKAALYEARLGLKSGEGKLSTSPPEKEPTVFTPGVSEKILTGLKEQAKVFKANDHIIYAEDFFDTATFAAIKEETQRLWRSEDIEANCNLDGTNRLGGYITDLLPHNSSLYHLIYGNDPFRHWVSAVNDEGPMWPSDFPIELREYGSQSKGMGCHPDLQMYKVPRKDLEFAFTVDNDSRCNVSFWDAAGKLHLVQTKPNSLMMVGVNAATHCVSSTEGGTRSILKFIYVGDYRKSDEFWHYTSNECDDSNPNRQMLSDRRAQRQREARSSSSEL